MNLGERYDIEYRIVDPSGRTKWLRARGELLRNSRKHPDRMIGVTFDVTSEKEANLRQLRTREELHELTARLQAIGVATGGLVWTSTPDGKIGDIPAWREFTGQSLKESEGWGWLNAIHPADRERTREVMQLLMDGKSCAIADYRVRSRTGGYRWFRSRCAPVLRADGSVAEWIGICEPLSRGFDEANAPQDGRGSRVAGPGPHLVSGAQVRAARAIVNWSVRDLAEASGVSSSTIRRIEGGCRRPGDARCAQARRHPQHLGERRRGVPAVTGRQGRGTPDVRCWRATDVESGAAG